MIIPITPFKEGFHKRGFPKQTDGGGRFMYWDNDNVGQEIKADYCEYLDDEFIVFYWEPIEGTPNQNFTIITKEVCRVKKEDVNFLHYKT